MWNRALAAIAIVMLWAQSAFPAILCSVLTANGDATNATNYTTASVTPAANRLILLAAVATRNATNDCVNNDIGTVTGNGLTWVAVAKQCFSTTAAPTHTVEIWRSMGATPSTGTINFAYSASTQLNAAWAVLECSAVNQSGTNGSGAVAQSGINAVEPGTSLTVTLGSFSASSNATLGVFALANNVAITPGSGFTQLTNPQVDDAGNDISLQVQWTAANDTSVDATFASNDAGGVAIEIVADASGDTGGDVLWFP